MNKIKEFFNKMWFYIVHKKCDTCKKWVDKTFHTTDKCVWAAASSENHCKNECYDCANVNRA